MRWPGEGGLVAALVKPQFELGPHQTDKGVVRDPALRQQAVDKVLLFCQGARSAWSASASPAVKGPKGNQEYIVCSRRVGWKGGVEVRRWNETGRKPLKKDFPPWAPSFPRTLTGGEAAWQGVPPGLSLPEC